MNEKREGFTLLEAVLSLALLTAAAVFAAGIFSGQLSLFARRGRLGDARLLAERVGSFLDETLSFGYDFSVDPDEADAVSYRLMEEQGEVRRKWKGGDWEAGKSLGREDGIQGEEGKGGLRVQVEFFDPEYGRVKLRVDILDGDSRVYREERTIISLYEEGERL